MHTQLQRLVASAFDEDDRQHAENRRLKQIATQRRDTPTLTRKTTIKRHLA